MRLRQEVVNVLLAQSLQDRGLAAVPEQIVVAAATGALRMPDVIADLQGLRLAIEGEFASTEHATELALRKATERVVEGIAHVGIGVVYPDELAHATFEQARAQLPAARLRFAVATEVPDEPEVVEGGLDDLTEALRRAYEQLVADEAVTRAVAALESGLERFAEALRGQTAVSEKLAAVLGVVDPAPGDPGWGGDD